MPKTDLTVEDLQVFLNQVAETEGGELAQSIYKLSDSDITDLFHRHFEHEENMRELVAESVATYLRTRNQK